jgi:uncharacterized membrane protein
MESHWRSIFKAVSWRVIATLITILVAYLLTNETKIALSIGIADTLLKLGIYFGHERVWNRLSFGRKEIKEDYMI